MTDERRNKMQCIFIFVVVQSLNCVNPMDCSPSGSSVHRIFPGKNTRVGCHFLLQGIFSIQGSSPCLLHWQMDSLPLTHLGSPYIHTHTHTHTHTHIYIYINIYLYIYMYFIETEYIEYRPLAHLIHK